MEVMARKTNNGRRRTPRVCPVCVQSQWRGPLLPSVSSMRPTCSFPVAVLLWSLGLPVVGGDFYQQFLSAVDTSQFTQPLGALPGLVDTNNTGIKLTNAVVDLERLK